MDTTTPDASRETLGDGAFAVLTVLFALSLSLNVWLGNLVRSNRVSFGPHSTSARGVEAATGGVPHFTNLRDLDGHPYQLGPASSRLIYVFSPTCKWCEGNQAAIHDLVRQVGSKFDVVGLVQSPNGMTQYLALHPQPFKVVVDDDPYDIAALDSQGTPQTIILVNGKVVHNWPGAYMGSVKRSIERALGISIVDASPPPH